MPRMMVVPSSWPRLVDDGASDDALYRSFADAVGGSEDEIRQHRRLFVPLAKQASAATNGMPLLDVGCGRGEFLDLLASAGVPAIGVDTSMSMGGRLRGAGLDVRTADANTFLRTIGTGELSSVAAFNVIEHMQPDYFLDLLRLVGEKVAAGGAAILHTSNPTCVFEMGVFWSDLTHVRPYHPTTVSVLLAQFGFVDLETHYYDPPPVPLNLTGDWTAAYRTYAVTGRKPG